MYPIKVYEDDKTHETWKAIVFTWYPEEFASSIGSHVLKTMGMAEADDPSGRKWISFRNVLYRKSADGNNVILHPLSVLYTPAWVLQVTSESNKMVRLPSRVYAVFETKPGGAGVIPVDTEDLDDKNEHWRDNVPYFDKTLQLWERPVIAPDIFSALAAINWYNHLVSLSMAERMVTITIDDISRLPNDGRVLSNSAYEGQTLYWNQKPVIDGTRPFVEENVGDIANPTMHSPAVLGHFDVVSSGVPRYLGFIVSSRPKYNKVLDDVIQTQFLDAQTDGAVTSMEPIQLDEAALSIEPAQTYEALPSIKPSGPFIISLKQAVIDAGNNLMSAGRGMMPTNISSTVRQWGIPEKIDTAKEWVTRQARTRTGKVVLGGVGAAAILGTALQLYRNNPLLEVAQASPTLPPPGLIEEAVKRVAVNDIPSLLPQMPIQDIGQAHHALPLTSLIALGGTALGGSYLGGRLLTKWMKAKSGSSGRPIIHKTGASRPLEPSTRRRLQPRPLSEPASKQKPQGVSLPKRDGQSSSIRPEKKTTQHDKSRAPRLSTSRTRSSPRSSSKARSSQSRSKSRTLRPQSSQRTRSGR